MVYIVCVFHIQPLFSFELEIKLQYLHWMKISVKVFNKLAEYVYDNNHKQNGK